jgi:hypothetical protein
VQFLKIFLLFVAMAGLSTSWAEPSYITFPSDISWKVKETEHFEAVFREGNDRFAERALIAAEKSHKLLTTIFKEAPPKTYLVLADFQDSLNGYALDFPYPHIVLFAAPPETAGQLAPLDDWLFSVVLHEYTHILHLYPAHGLWAPMRFIFGSWVVPNGMMPAHLHEGMATFMETHFTKGGRGRGATFNMYKRKAVEAGAWGQDFAPPDVYDGTILRWPFGAAPYLFGYTLYQDLYRRKKEPGLWALTLSSSDNWPYLVHSPAKDIYGKNFDDLWKDIYSSEKAEQEKEIEKIRLSGLSKLSYLTQSRFQKWDLAADPSGNKIAYRSHRPGELHAIEIVDAKSGNISQRLPIDTSPAEGICWTQQNGNDALLYSGTWSKDNYTLNALYLVDLTSKSSQLVKMRDEKIDHLHGLSCMHDRLLMYREQAGRGTVLETTWTAGSVKVEKTREWNVPEGMWVSGLSASPEGHWIAIRKGTGTDLYRWKASAAEPLKVLELPYAVSKVRASTKTDTVLAISDRDGRYEMWEIYPSKREMRKVVSLMGGLNSFETASDKVWLLSYEHGGYDLATAERVMASARAIEKTEPEKADAKKTTEEDKPSISATSSYSPWSTLYPRAWVPSMLFVPDGAQFGVWIPGFDVSQKHFYDFFGGYDTRGLPFASLTYAYRFGGDYTLDVTPYYFPSYLVSSRAFVKRWGGNLGVSTSLGPITFRIGTLYKKIDYASLGPTDSVGVQVSATYKIGFPKRPLAISPVNGVKLGVTHDHFFHALGSTANYWATVVALDQYWQAPWWGNSVFYLGAKTGVTEGARFVDSYFESGGELLFAQSRGTFFNRGFSPGTFFGRRLFNATLEYRFPIARIERGWGLSPAFLRVIHAALVADTTSPDKDPATGRQKKFLSEWYTSAGVELRSDWKFFYYLPSQIRVGAYHGFGNLPDAKNIYVTVGLEAGL